MKNLRLFMITSLMLLSIAPMPLNAVNSKPAPTPAPVNIESVDTKIMMSRITEIKAMDKSKLNAAEKKQLKQELRQMKKAISGGVYLSVGTILIILLILILIL